MLGNVVAHIYVTAVASLTASPRNYLLATSTASASASSASAVTTAGMVYTVNVIMSSWIPV